MLAGRSALLLLCGAALGLGVNALRPDGVRLDAWRPVTACEVPATPIEILPPDGAAHLCHEVDTLVADVRDSARFAKGHIARALHLPCASSGDVASRALASMANHRAVVVYGDTTDEARPVAEALQKRLATAGKAARVVVLDGGYGAWDQHGLACSKGPCPDCAALMLRKEIQGEAGHERGLPGAGPPGSTGARFSPARSSGKTTGGAFVQ
jgi:rhodanese-related sulfurtransferase